MAQAIEMIQKCCRENGISISRLEQDLGFSNGSIAKAKNISAERLLMISKYFGKSMEYFLTGETAGDIDAQIINLREKQEILIKINKTQSEMIECESRMRMYAERIMKLQEDLANIEKR